MKTHLVRRYLTICLSFFSLTFIAGLCTSNDPDPCNLKTDDTPVYSGVNSFEIRTLLENSKPWKTPACPGGKDFQYPLELSQQCIRDQFVVAAVKLAFVAEYKWRAGEKSEAENYAKLARAQLDQADALCSNKPVVATGYTCTTLNVWPCNTTPANPGGSTTPATGSTQIAFKNPVFTSITITLNGETKVVEPGSTITFEGKPGTTGQFKAETSAKSSQGTQVGNLITWDGSYNFPGSGIFTVNLNLGAQWFFLYVTNESSRKINKVYVNYGLQSQTLENASISNDKIRYRLGYYRAFSNSNLRIEGDGNWVWTHVSPDFKLDFTENQSYTFTAR